MDSRFSLLIVLFLSLLHCSTSVTGAVRASAARAMDCGEMSCLRACDNGDAESCLSLGRAFEEEEDRDSALDAYSRGCDLDHVGLCRLEVEILRVLGREGEADSLLQRVCRRDHAMCIGLFEGVEDLEAISELEPVIEASCERGDSASCRALARVYREQERTLDAEQWLRRACDAGDLEGCLHLADVLEELGQSDAARSIRELARDLGAED